MKTLLIPPIHYLNLAAGRKYHLVLSHLIDHNAYTEFYRNQSDQGSYVILDNSAHEFQMGENIHHLLKQARQLKASEIVLPDHLFESKDTVARTKQALQYIVEHKNEFLSMTPVPNFMIVPQGRSPQQFSDCLFELLNVYNDAQIKLSQTLWNLTIGVSKDYEIWAGGLFALLDKTVIPVAQKEDIQVHVLGWGRDLWALQHVSRVFGNSIRSIDSAKPFVYGMYGIKLDPPLPAPVYPKRPNDYFTAQVSEHDLETIKWNIQVFDNLVD